MRRFGLAAGMMLVMLVPAMAQQSCDSRAIGKDGKVLAGAAKASFVRKCKVDTCSPKAVSADGKKLSGAAKTSFMKKCEADS